MGVSLLPRLLDGSGNEVRRLAPIRESISLKIMPLSYATIELPAGETIATGSWIELFTETGSVGVFRAKTPEDGYGDLSVSVQLEHGIVETSDFLVKHDYEEESTVATALGKIWQNYGGSKWQLGTISQSDGVILRTDFGTNVLEAMLAVLKQTPQYMLSFNFTTSPWTVGVTARDTNVSAEARLSRNVESVKISRDDSELCTRAYLMGLPGSTDTVPGHIDADTISTYGVIEREIEQSGNYTAAQAQRIANQYLAKHKRPTLSIEISGYDLSQLTGETWDSFHIGQKLRLAIPEDSGSPYEETVIGLSYSDIVTNPRAVTVSMAEEEDGVISFLHKQDTTGGRSGRSGRYSTKKSLNGIESDLSVQADRITAEVTNRQNADTTLSGRITVEAGKISQVVTAVGKDGQVTAASIVTAINGQTGEGIVYIDANKIVLEGTTTLKGMMTIDNGNLQVNGNVYAGLNGSNYFQGNKLRLVGGSSSQGADIAELAYADISDMIIKAEISGNTLKLWKKGDSKTGTPSITFSKATTQSPGWSGNAVLTISAKQGTTTVDTYDIGFGTSYNSHKMDLELVANGAVEQDTGSIIKVPVAIRQLTGSQSAPTSRYTKDLSVACSGLLETKNISSNDTYTPSTGKIGFSSVTVTVVPTLNGNWSSSVLTVSSAPAAAANYTVGFGTTYGSHSVDLELTTNGAASQDSGSTISVPLKIQQLTGSQSAPASRYEKTVAVACSGLLETKSVNSNDTYTPSSGKIGFSSFTVNVHPTLDANWASGKITVTSSPSASSNLTRTLAQGTASWASDSKSVTVPINATWGSSGQYSESTGWSVSVNTTSAYNAGSSSVLLSDTLTWGTTPSGDINVSQNSVTVQTSGRVNTSGSSDEKTKTINLYSQSSTSGLTATFYVTHTDSTDAKRIIKRTETCSDAYLLPENIKYGVTIFGVPGSYAPSSATISYVDCYAPVGAYSGGYTNNSSGYDKHSNSDVGIVVQVIPHYSDGTTGSAYYNFLAWAPTNLWGDAYSAGQASMPTYNRQVTLTRVDNYTYTTTTYVSTSDWAIDARKTVHFNN